MLSCYGSVHTKAVAQLELIFRTFNLQHEEFAVYPKLIHDDACMRIAEVTMIINISMLSIHFHIYLE